MNEKYLALRIIAWIFSFLGWVSIALSAYFLWGIIYGAKTPLSLIVPASIFWFALNGLAPLMLFGISQLIMVVIDIEYNTRMAANR